jgi:hypothetical protein
LRENERQRGIKTMGRRKITRRTKKRLSKQLFELCKIMIKSPIKIFNDLHKSSVAQRKRLERLNRKRT